MVTNLTGERLRGSDLTLTFLAHCLPLSVLSGEATSLGLLDPLCWDLTFKGTGLCFTLATLSGANGASVDGEGGLIFIGVGLYVLLSLNLSGIVLDLIGAKAEEVPGPEDRTKGDTWS